MTDFRALCAELVENLKRCQCWYIEDTGFSIDTFEALLRRADATLAQPEPQGPSDEELDEQFFEHCYTDDFGNELMERQQFRKGARAVLARWGRPAIEPVPASERPWKREGWCDAQGRCYGWDGDYWWMVGNPGSANETITHWLPYWALPVPGVEGKP